MFIKSVLHVLRTIRNKPTYSIISILGLTIGFASAIFIFQFIHFHLSFDKHFEKSENIVRVTSEWFQNGEFMEHRAAAVPGMHHTLKNDYPEIKTYARYHKGSTNVVRLEGRDANIKFEEKNIFYADPEFFEVFDLNFVDGRPINEEPQELVISEKVAKKYFGDKSAIGQVLSFDGEFSFSGKVVGVFEDFASNTHLTGDFIFSLKTKENLVPFDISDNWIWRSFYTYLVLSPNADKERLQEEINQYVVNNKTEYYNRGSYKVIFHLQRLEDIHLSSHLFEEIKVNGNKSTLRILAIAGLFLVLISLFNYVNLTTVRNVHRSKEIAIRQIVGAPYAQLLGYQILQSVVFIGLSIALAIFSVSFAYPTAKAALGLEFELYVLRSFNFWLIISLLVVAITLLSGIYPAWVMKYVSTTDLLNGKMNAGKAKFKKMQMIVSFQFILSLGLVLCIVVIYSQTRHMLTRDLGIRKDQILIINGPKIKGENYYNKLDFFKEELMSSSSINHVSTASALPGEITGAGRDFRNAIGERKFLNIVRVDYGFEEVFDLEVVAGQSFSSENKLGDSSLVLNEKAIKEFGFDTNDDAISSSGLSWNNVGGMLTNKIIGVMKDYYPDAQSQVIPTVFVLNRVHSAPWDPEFYVVQIEALNMSHVNEIIDSIEKKWSAIFPQDPLNYQFADDFFDQQFQSEYRLMKTVTFFGVVSVVLSMIGFVALLSFSNHKRKREIGIRKVLGSSELQAYYFLIRKNMDSIVVSVLITIPVFAWLLSQWLENYQYRIELDLLIIAFPVLLFIAVIAVVIILQATHIVKQNPTEVLKEE